jgi:4'-phosphopantetheinyl transferase
VREDAVPSAADEGHAWALPYIRLRMSAGAAAGMPPQDGSARSWTPGPREPVLEPLAIHVWRVDLSATGEQAVCALSAHERERAQRIVGPREQRLWSRSRGVLRDLLGRYLKADPGSLELAVGAHGKPRLGGRWSEDGLHFNLSHSGELALYAFTACGAIGADVEVLREPSRGVREHRAALATRVFGAEAAERLGELPPELREREFLRLWTRHEAELKRRGAGIGAASAEEQGVGEAHAKPWIVELNVGRLAVAALASECDRASELRLWEWA